MRATLRIQRRLLRFTGVVSKVVAAIPFADENELTLFENGSATLSGALLSNFIDRVQILSICEQVHSGIANLYPQHMAKELSHWLC